MSLPAMRIPRLCTENWTATTLTPPQRWPGPQRWLLAAAVLLGWQPASALGPPLRVARSVTFYKPTKKQIPTVIIRGIVLGTDDHRPVPGTAIQLKDSAIGDSAGPDGTFEFFIPASQLKAKSFKLVISMVGYNNQQIKLKTEESGHLYSLQISLRPTVYID